MTTTMTLTATEPEVSAAAPHESQLDRHGYLFGKHLEASLSPFLHEVIYGELSLRWAQIRLDSADIPNFLELTRHPRFYGASVTMPNKVAILPHLDDTTPECREVGACNTVFVRTDPLSGRRLLIGANTDVVGVREAFVQNTPPSERGIWAGRPGLVIGGGGAARSAVYALRRWLGVTDIYLINRDEEEVKEVIEECVSKGFGEGLVHVRNVEEAARLEAPGAVVSCIPDLMPRTEAEKACRRVVETMLEKEEKGVMLEMCYNPSPFTALGALAESKGWRVILGTEALIWQGLEQDKYWTGRDIAELPVKRVHDAIAERLAQHPKR